MADLNVVATVEHPHPPPVEAPLSQNDLPPLHQSYRLDGSALYSTKRDSFPQRGSFIKSGDGAPSKPFKKDDRWCSYCKRSGHIKDLCFRLHGKQNVLDKMAKMRGQAHLTSSDIADGPNAVQPPSSEFTSIRSDELERIRTILESLSKPSGTSTLAMTDISSTSHSFVASCADFKKSWIIDSGATDHMACCADSFNSYNPTLGTHTIAVADGSHTSVAGSGNIYLQPSLHLQNALHVPKLSTNLLSIHKITKDLNCTATFFPTHCVFQDLATGKMIGGAKEQGGLYYLDASDQGVKDQSLLAHGQSTAYSLNWLHHKRLGHPPFSLLKSLFPSLFLSKSVESFHCDVCEFAKHHRVSFPSSTIKSVEPFELIHSDVWGPSKVPHASGNKWFVSFIDDCTRVTWIYLMHEKSEVPQLFVRFYKMIETQFGKRIKRLRSDNGTEYVNQRLSQFIQDQGMIHELTCVDTPQQNGVAERKNRHLLEVARALLFQTHVPKHYWGDAIYCSFLDQPLTLSCS